MGKLDFSVIDPRVKPLSERIRFGGREKNKKLKEDFLQRLDQEYVKIKEGSTTIIDAGGSKTKFLGKKEYQKSMDTIRACGDVKREVMKFEEENGRLRSYFYKESWQSPTFIGKFLTSGEREISSVDIKHCYWRILFINNIISEKLYMKYEGDKDARVISVGCLNKTQTIFKYKGTTLLNKKQIKNPLRWVWDFVCWKTYKAIRKALEACKENAFAYHSDGIYLPTEYASSASKAIKSLDFDCRVIKYTIIGQNNNLIVLLNKKTGETKRANLGNIRNIDKKILPEIEYVKKSSKNPD